MIGDQVGERAESAGARRRRIPGARRSIAAEGASPARVIAPRHGVRDGVRRRLLATGDCFAIVFGMWAGVNLVGEPLTVGQMVWIVALLPGWLVVYKGYGLYDRDLKRISHNTLDDIPWLFHATLVGTLLMSALLRLAPGKPIHIREALIAGGTALVLVILTRAATRRFSARLLGSDRVLFVGEHAHVALIVRKLRDHPEYGLEPVGVLTTKGERDGPPPVPRLGPLVATELGAVMVDHSIDRIIVSHDGLEVDDLLTLVRRCRELGVKVSVLPEIFDALGPSVEIDDVEGVTVLGITPPVLSPSSRALKRALDVVCASVGLVLAGPVMALAAIAIKLDSKGAVLFRQERVGRRGRPFRVLKFRTMCPDAERQAAALAAMSRDPDWLLLDDDPRVTRVGRFLRRTSIDELPQLYNVLRGQMSMVGPRPLVAAESARLDGWRLSRIDLTPGLTGLWQVLGRTRIPFEEMIKLDYLYVTNWSLWTDVRLMMRTLPAVLGRRGVN